MKTIACAATAAIVLLVGCSQKVTEIPGLDRVMTAAEFQAQPAVQNRVLAFCANDPGRYRADPNCVNASQAFRLASSGTGNFPRLDTSLPPGMTSAQSERK